MVKSKQSEIILFIRRLYLSVILLLALTTWVPLWAQIDQGTIRLGGQVGIGTEIESFGIGIRGDYALTPKFLLALDFMYFFGDEDYGVEADWSDLNFNANYLIETKNPTLVPYVLGGLNIARTSVSCEGVLSSVCDDFSDTDIGFNVGGGLDIMLASIALFGELRVSLSDANQVVIASGIKLPIN